MISSSGIRRGGEGIKGRNEGDRKVIRWLGNCSEIFEP
jgi:hypothetical protein